MNKIHYDFKVWEERSNDALLLLRMFLIVENLQFLYKCEKLKYILLLSYKLYKLLIRIFEYPKTSPTLKFFKF